MEIIIQLERNYVNYWPVSLEYREKMGGKVEGYSHLSRQNVIFTVQGTNNNFIKFSTYIT